MTTTTASTSLTPERSLTAGRPVPGTTLWVSAHPRRDSFNGLLTRAGTEVLSSRGDVLTTDLYGQGFDPVLRLGDLGEEAGDRGNIAHQIAQAHARGQVPAQVREEQGKLAAADLLVLQFPLWWYGPPAILKGWFDRIFTEGFAYGETDPELGVPRRYGDGGLRGRRALVVVTVGEDPASIGPRGISGDIDALLFPLTHGALWYTGVDVLDLHVVHDADSLGTDGAQREVERLATRLADLDAEPAVPFRTLRGGDYRGTRALHEGILPGRADLGIHRR